MDETVRRALLPVRSPEEWLQRVTDAYAVLAAMVGAVPYSRADPGIAARGMLIHYLQRVDQWITLAYHQMVENKPQWGEH
jgi:hypothetical protein